MKSKELRAQRAQIITAAKELISSDNPTDEQNAQFDKMMADADRLQAQIERLDRAEAEDAKLAQQVDRQARERGVSADQLTDEQQRESHAFSQWLRVGTAGMEDELRPLAQSRIAVIKNAQSGNTGTGGGYVVPEGFYGQVIEAQRSFGGMFAVGATVIDSETGNPLPIPTTNDTAQEGMILGENTQVAPGDVTFGQAGLGAYTYSSKLVLVPNALLADSAFNLDAWLSRVLGTRLARIENRHLTGGSGASQPAGVMTGATLGKAGAAGQVATVLVDDLIDLIHAVDPAYRQTSRFMLPDASFKMVRKLKDSTGRPIWSDLSNIVAGAPSTILGYAFTINQHMDAPAASAKSIAFGDFANYMIRRVASVQVMRLTERYADLYQTGFVAFQRMDGVLVDAGTHPIQYYQHPAA